MCGNSRKMKLCLSLRTFSVFTKKQENPSLFTTLAQLMQSRIGGNLKNNCADFIDKFTMEFSGWNLLCESLSFICGV